MSALKKALIGILLVAGVVASLLVAQEASARGRGGIGRPGVDPGGVARRPVPGGGSGPPDDPARGPPERHLRDGAAVRVHDGRPRTASY